MYLTHAQIVLSDQVVEDGALLIKDGAIAAINPEGSVSGMEVDLCGAVLSPGLVDLHCDALEKEVEPRPNVRFPIEFALREADKRNALCGVTTPSPLRARNLEFAITTWPARSQGPSGGIPNG